MIKAIIFDLGGVYFTDGTKIAIDKLSRKYNVDKMKVENIMKVGDILKVGDTLGQEYRKGNLTANEFWNKVKRLLKIKASNKELNNIWVKGYSLIRGTLAIIKKLKKSGIDVYFLSDTVKERIAYLQNKYKFLENFDGGIFSYKLHTSKFEGEGIFKLALKKTNENPRNVIYVDDKEMYVETAKKIGMNSIAFKNPKQLEMELKKYKLI